MANQNPSHTIGYLRVSTDTQDLDKNRADILTLANKEDLGRVRFVEEKVSGKIPWRKRKIATILDELSEGDALIVSELSRLGRSMLECMEILSIAAAHIRVYAIKGDWRLDETIQSKIIAMAFSMDASMQQATGGRIPRFRWPDVIGTGGRILRNTHKGARKEQTRSISARNRGTARQRINPEIYSQTLQHHSSQPVKLDQKAPDQKTKQLKILWWVTYLCWVRARIAQCRTLLAKNTDAPRPEPDRTVGRFVNLQPPSCPCCGGAMTRAFPAPRTANRRTDQEARAP